MDNSPTETREMALSALLSLVSEAFDWAAPPVRRLQLWADVPFESRPCAFLYEGCKETYAWKNNNFEPVRTIEVQLLVYINAQDPMAIGASMLNDIMQRLDRAMRPSGSDVGIGRNTLGGWVYQCRIDGNPLKDPGDISGDGVLVVPIKLILP